MGRGAECAVHAPSLWTGQSLFLKLFASPNQALDRQTASLWARGGLGLEGPGGTRSWGKHFIR